ncbi:hypothetical protein [Cellulomonas hominis]
MLQINGERVVVLAGLVASVGGGGTADYTARAAEVGREALVGSQTASALGATCARITAEWRRLDEGLAAWAAGVRTADGLLADVDTALGAATGRTSAGASVGRGAGASGPVPR